MDSKLSVQHGHHHHHNGVSKPPVHHGGKRAAGRKQGCGGAGTKGVKVVYISSPMKLTTSAEEFRAVVQDLTGRDSNVADHDLDGAACYAGGPSSSSSSSYSSFGRVSPTGAGAAGASAMSPTTMATANAGAPGRAAAHYAAAAAAGMAAPAAFQGMYDQTAAGNLIYGHGQDYYW